MTSIFSNDTLNSLFDNNDIASIKSVLDTSLNEIINRTTGYDEATDYDLVNDAYIFNSVIKEKNDTYLESLTSVANSIKDANINGLSSVEDYINAKEKSELLDTNNKNNMKYYIENYFFIIVKVLLILLLLYFLFTLSNSSIFSISIGKVFSNIYKKISSTSSSVNENLSKLKNNIKKPDKPKFLKNSNNNSETNKKLDSALKEFNTNNEVSMNSKKTLSSNSIDTQSKTNTTPMQPKTNSPMTPVNQTDNKD